MLAGQPAPVVLADKGAIGDAQQRVMGLIHLGLAEMHVVGGDQRQAAGIGHVQQHILGGALLGQAMALQFDVQPSGKGAGELLQDRVGRITLAFHDRLVEHPARSPGQEDQALGMGEQLLHLHMRPVTGFHIQIGGGQKLGEVLVARLVLHQEGNMGRLLARSGLQRIAGGDLHRQHRAHDGLDAALGQCVGDLKDPEQVVVVGDGHRRGSGVPGQLHHLAGAHSALQQRIGALDAQMDEGGHDGIRDQDSGAQYRLPAPRMGRRTAPIHSDQMPAWLIMAWAPLASTKAVTMKRISPAPAAASLAHMITFSRLVGFCSTLVPSRMQEQTVIELP